MEKIKSQTTATIFGFLIAPLAPVSLMGIMSLPNNGPWSVFFGVALIVYIYACIFMLIIGLPIYIALTKLNLMRWWAISMVGILVGGAIGYAYRLPFYPERYQSGLVQGLGCGIAGIVFWMIWRRGKTNVPDS